MTSPLSTIKIFLMILLSSNSILLTSLANDLTTIHCDNTDNCDDSTTDEQTSEEAPTTKLPPPNSCDTTMRAYIHDFCQRYYSLPDCQGTTMPMPVYDCAFPSKLVDPLFNNDTATMAQIVLELYANTDQETSDEESVQGALQVLCGHFADNGFMGCTNSSPDYTDDLRIISSGYKRGCSKSASEVDSATKKFYEYQCMIAQIQQANATCSELYYKGCLTGSALNEVCLKNLAIKN